VEKINNFFTVFYFFTPFSKSMKKIINFFTVFLSVARPHLGETGKSDDYHDLQVSCSGGFSPSIADKRQPKIMSFVVQVRSTRNSVLLHYILLIPSNLLVLRRRGLKHM
jgi:hypothetical protein